MPISLQVLIILKAISPRLAMSIFLNKGYNLKFRKFTLQSISIPPEKVVDQILQGKHHQLKLSQ